MDKQEPIPFVTYWRCAECGDYCEAPQFSPGVDSKGKEILTVIIQPCPTCVGRFKKIVDIVRKYDDDQLNQGEAKP